jgi:hypothetical protein
VAELLSPFEADLQHWVVCLKTNEWNPGCLSHSSIGRSWLIQQVRLTVVQHLPDSQITDPK